MLLSAVGAVVLFLPSEQVFAGTCIDGVAALARAYELTIDPPDLSESGAAGDLGVNELSLSGGIVEPPPTGDAAVIEPKNDYRYGMSTLPDSAGGDAGVWSPAKCRHFAKTMGLPRDRP